MSHSIALTLGEPGGIGPDLFLQLTQKPLSDNLIIIADVHLLEQRAKQLNIPFLSDHHIVHIDAMNIDCCGQALAENAAYVLKTLDRAIEGCLQHEFLAIVTGPVQKSSINAAGFSFTGHTEYLAKKIDVEQILMCFENYNIRIALATTHVPLKAVPDLITPTLLTNAIELLNLELQNKFKIPRPKILVCGLNPHAGEAGYLGQEDQEIILPTINKLKKQGIDCEGPFPADTILQHKADCILSLYHDQLLPAIKYQHFFDTVNITLGLPFIRTSVDHGTALNLAGAGKTNPSSLQCAIETAIRLSHA